MNYEDAKLVMSNSKALFNEIKKIVEECRTSITSMKYFGETLTIALATQYDAIVLSANGEEAKSFSIGATLDGNEEWSYAFPHLALKYFTDACAGFPGNAMEPVYKDSFLEFYLRSSCQYPMKEIVYTRFKDRYDAAVKEAVSSQDLSKISFTFTVELDDVNKDFIDAAGHADGLPCASNCFSSDAYAAMMNDGWFVLMTVDGSADEARYEITLKEPYREEPLTTMIPTIEKFLAKSGDSKDFFPQVPTSKNMLSGGLGEVKVKSSSPVYDYSSTSAQRASAIIQQELGNAGASTAITCVSMLAPPNGYRYLKEISDYFSISGLYGKYGVFDLLRCEHVWIAVHKDLDPTSSIDEIIAQCHVFDRPSKLKAWISSYKL